MGSLLEKARMNLSRDWAWWLLSLAGLFMLVEALIITDYETSMRAVLAAAGLVQIAVGSSNLLSGEHLRRKLVLRAIAVVAAAVSLVWLAPWLLADLRRLLAAVLIVALLAGLRLASMRSNVRNRSV